jgi:redox-sensitive bicupin YhaK (pirin superfamily)
MKQTKKTLLKGYERGIFGNDSFKIRSVFSNGRAGTGRPENFGPLLVFNDDIVSPEGFLGLHPHENIEVIAVVLEGSELQQDDKGNIAELLPDDFQLISSGSGINHAAGNPSKTNFARNLQIWIRPRELNTPPSTQIKKAQPQLIKNHWILQFSPDGASDSIQLRQDAWLSKGRFEKDITCEYSLYAPGNGVMVYLIDGKIELQDQVLEAHDSLLLYEANNLSIRIIEEAHIQLVETFAKEQI